MAKQGAGGATGIILEIDWTEPLAELVVERDTDSGFGGSVEIARLSTVVSLYTDELSIDGVTYYYRARHEVKVAGQADSAWSSSVNDTPHEL